MLEVNATFWVQMINLVIFFIIMRVYLIKPIMKILQERRENIARSLEDTERLIQESTELRDSYHRKIKDLESRGETILSEFRNEGEKMKEQALQSAKKEAREILAKARLEIDSMREQTLREIHSKSVETAVAISRKILVDSLDREVQEIVNRKMLEKVKNYYSGE